MGYGFNSDFSKWEVEGLLTTTSGVFSYTHSTANTLQSVNVSFGMPVEGYVPLNIFKLVSSEYYLWLVSAKVFVFSSSVTGYALMYSGQAQMYEDVTIDMWWIQEELVS